MTKFVECPSCKGQTIKKGKPCPTCLGSGSVPEATLLEIDLDREQVAFLPEGLAN